MTARLPCMLRMLAITGTLAAGGVSLEAQGSTTATVAGSVMTDGQDPLTGSDIVVINRATGVVAHGMTRRGRYEVPNLEIGGPYLIIARAIGFRPSGRDSVFLRLGERLELDFRLERAATTLEATVVNAQPALAGNPSGFGLVTVISDSLLRRLPTRNRNLYDFVQLSPYVYTAVRGISGGGTNFRYNSFLIDGAGATALFGRNPAGDPKSIPIDAVREYQVVISPYDVSQGNFAGVLVNAVTQSGTNTFHGSTYVYARNERLARDVPLLRDSPYEQVQYGLSLGGPIVRDRVHFFVATELQHLAAPVPGPYVGQLARSAVPVPADTADIRRFIDLLRTRGIDAGSAGPMHNESPLTNLFARIDVALPRWRSRLVLSHNYGDGEFDSFTRIGDGSTFPLGSLGVHQIVTSNVTLAQLFTRFSWGANVLTVQRYSQRNAADPAVRAPLVSVAVPRSGAPGVALLQAGSVEGAQNRDDRQRDVEIGDNLSIPVGTAHRLTVGASAEFQRVSRLLVSGSYGAWTFSSLDSLAVGQAATYHVAEDFGGGYSSFTGVQYGVYAADRWQVTDHLVVIAGLRVDIPVLHGNPPYSPAVDSLFGLRTDVVPSGGVAVSPRVGFVWETADGRDRVRGGVGIFTSRAPLVWWLDAFGNYGEGVRALSCGRRSTDVGPAPAFDPHYLNPPSICANGLGFRTNRGGPVNVLDPGLRYPRVLRTSLAYDRQLPWGIVASVEGIYTRGAHDFLFLNRALRGPVAIDRFGRVLYGTIDSTGAAVPNLVSNRYPAVFELVNQSRNYSYDLAVTLEKRWSSGVEASIAYTYSRVRDAQTPLNPLFGDNWQSGRAFSGPLDALEAGVSDFDQPHRIVAVATYSAPWSKLRTSLSLYYVGGSGIPFTYTAAQGSPSTGDLNADGTALDDPIYVPKTALDSNQIRFAGTPAEVAVQQQAFEHFIGKTPCLSSQRGHIMSRNSCRSPWVHTLNVALRQGLPSPRGHALAIEVQLFNVLNFLRARWGLVKLPNAALLEQVGQTAGAPGQSQPVFRFQPDFAPFSSDNLDSYYQLQLAVRYSF